MHYQVMHCVNRHVLVLAALLAANSATQALQSQCELSRKIEAATRDESAGVRRAAVRMLGNRGQGSSLAVLSDRVHDPDEGVREATVEAVAELRYRGGDYGQKAVELLCAAAHDSSGRIRECALFNLAHRNDTAAIDCDGIKKCLDDPVVSVHLWAAAALAACSGDKECEARNVALISQYSGSAYDSVLAELLDGIHDRGNEAVIRRLLEGNDPHARFKASCALERLRSEGSQWSAALRVESDWKELYQKAEGGLRRAAWTRIPRVDLLARMRDARLVLFGEMHEPEGPMRDNQRDVLRAFAKEAGHEAVGYEPSVEGVQQSVLDLARSLGMRVIPLEVHWKELVAEHRDGARDAEAGEAIEAFLGEHQSNRMLVLRGESHVLPGGPLVSKLSVQPIVILSGSVVNVPLCDGELRCNGTAFRVGNTGSVYALPYDDKATAKEETLLEKHMGAH